MCAERWKPTALAARASDAACLPVALVRATVVGMRFFLREGKTSLCRVCRNMVGSNAEKDGVERQPIRRGM